MYRLLPALLLGCLSCLAAAPAAAFDFATTPGALPKTVRPVEYRIALDADPARTGFSGRAEISLEVTAPTRDIVLHADALAVSEASVDGAGALTIVTDAAAQRVTLRAAAPLRTGRHTLRLAWSGTLDENDSGLYRVRYRTDDGAEKWLLATQMEPIGARRMAPLFDEPAFRARFALSVTIPAGLVALSNMPALQTEALGDGRQRVRFATTSSMPSYLLALAIGAFEANRTQHAGVSLAIWTVEGRSARTGYAMDATRRALDALNAYFGMPYPLPKLDQIAIPGKQGAMENWGLITYGEDLLVIDPARADLRARQRSFGVIAHELAHQWFGNLVTMAWWDDLWLNEAFAEWMGQRVTLALNPDWRRGDWHYVNREEALGADALPTAPPIARPVASDRAASDSFDAATYNKGSMVLGLLEQYLGEATLRAGLRRYLKQHAWGNATGDDLWRALAQASGKPVNSFAHAWIRQPGHPRVQLGAECRNGRGGLLVRQARHGFGAAANDPALWPVPLAVAYGPEARTLHLTRAEQWFPLGACAQDWSVRAGNADLWRVDPARGFPLARALADTMALAERGDRPFGEVMALLGRLTPDDEVSAWTAALDIIERVDAWAHGTPEQAVWRARSRVWLAPLVAAPGTGDPLREVAAARARLRLGIAGDPAVLAEARSRWAAGTLPGSDVAGDFALLGVLAAQADPTTMDALIARALANTEPALHGRWVAALSRAEHPVAVESVLALTFADCLPRSARRSVVSRVAAAGRSGAAIAYTERELDRLLATTSEWGQRFVFAAPLERSRDTSAAVRLLVGARARLGEAGSVATQRAVAAAERNAEAWARLAPLLAASAP